MGRVLITGAAGFLGSHLAKELIAQGRKVIGLDNLSTGKISNLQEILSHPNFTFKYFDVALHPDLEHNKWMEIETYEDIAEIYHLASLASPKFYQAAPFETIAVNTIGTKNMLDLTKRFRAKFLFSSTSEAYGDPEIHPQPEIYRGNVNTWGPRGCYDEAKRLGEVYCYEYFSRYGLQVKVARIFNTYSAGLRNDDGRVISNFVTQALTGQDITVYGDGSQTRSFCYVDDTIRGLIRMMETKETNGEIVNIGNSKEYTILEVAQLVVRLAGTNNRLTFQPLPADDPRRRRPDNGKAKQLLGWEPLIDLEEGLQRTISHYRAGNDLIGKGRLL